VRGPRADGPRSSRGPAETGSVGWRGRQVYDPGKGCYNLAELDKGFRCADVSFVSHELKGVADPSARSLSDPVSGFPLTPFSYFMKPLCALQVQTRKNKWAARSFSQPRKDALCGGHYPPASLLGHGPGPLATRRDRSSRTNATILAPRRPNPHCVAVAVTRSTPSFCGYRDSSIAER